MKSSQWWEKKTYYVQRKKDKITADTVSKASPQKLFKQENNRVTSLKYRKKLSTCISTPSKILFKNEGKIMNFFKQRKVERIHYQQPFTTRNANRGSSGRRKITHRNLDLYKGWRAPVVANMWQNISHFSHFKIYS